MVLGATRNLFRYEGAIVPLTLFTIGQSDVRGASNRADQKCSPTSLAVVLTDNSCRGGVLARLELAGDVMCGN